MMNLRQIIFEITEDKRVLKENLELKEIMDSYTIIELFSRLEEIGIIIYPTRINLGNLKTISDLEKVIKEYQ